MRKRLMRMLLVGVAGAIGRVVQRRLQERKHGDEGMSAHGRPGGLGPDVPVTPAPAPAGYPDVPKLQDDGPRTS
jgi:hypothetical protein